MLKELCFICMGSGETDFESCDNCRGSGFEYVRIHEVPKQDPVALAEEVMKKAFGVAS